MAHCIPTYMLASGLMASGMNWCAGAVHDPARQHDRADPDPAQLASRDEVRHPVPGLRARRLRHVRIQPARADARARGLRLVRDPGLDRRRGAAHVLHEPRARVADAARRRLPGAHDHGVAVVPAVLGPQHPDHLQGHEPAAHGRELGGAVRAGDDRRAAGLGGARSPRPRAAARATRQAAHARASSCRSSCRR